GGCAA
ncbi:hypothetical protein KTAU_01450, partial [Thermogemmatispora aurantia]